jgi:hypothetical protein
MSSNLVAIFGGVLIAALLITLAIYILLGLAAVVIYFYALFAALLA